MTKEKTLYVSVFQPFAQYRNPFTFYYGQTFPLPPKSTIIGLLQNATNRYYDPSFWDLSISIHGGFESVFWNYQSMISGDIDLIHRRGELVQYNQKRPLYGQGLKSQRSPVYQQELFNGHLGLFVKGDKSLINEIQEAFERPRKILGIGRSEDVIFIKEVVPEEQLNWKEKIVKQTLWIQRPMYLRYENQSKEFPIKNQKYPVFSIPSKVTFENSGEIIKTKAQLSGETDRKTDFQTVIYAGNDFVIYLKDDVRIVEYTIDDKIFKIPSEYGWL